MKTDIKVKEESNTQNN